MSRSSRGAPYGHRSIWQAAGVYAGASWLAYEITAELVVRVGLPAWVLDGALLLLVLGLPVVVATAYAQAVALQVRERERVAADDDAAQRALDPTLHPELTAEDEALPRATDGERVASDDEMPLMGRAARQRAVALRLAQVLTWRRSLVMGTAMFALLVLGTTGFMGARQLGIGPAATLLTQGMLETRDPILIADFTGERDPELARTVAEALRIDLVQSPVIRVADAEFVRAALRRMERDPADGLPPDVARALAEREGVKALIRGDVRALGGGYVLTAELVGGSDGDVIAAFRETARDSTQLIDAVDRLSNRLRERIGESLRTIRGTASLAAVTTSSLPALRHYSQGLAVSRQTGDLLHALEFYERALAADSAFGSAWLAVGIVLSNMDLAPGRRNDAVRRAYELRDRLSQREYWLATAAYEVYVRDDRYAGGEAYRSLLALEPDNGAARNNLAGTLVMQRRFAEAEQVLLEAAPAARSASMWLNLITAQYSQGRTEAALASLGEAAQRIPAHLVLPMIELWIRAAEGELAAADSIAAVHQAALGGSPGAQAGMGRMRAQLAAQAGRLAAVQREYAQSDRLAGLLDLTEARFRLEVARQSILLLYTGDPERRVRDVQLATQRLRVAELPVRSRAHLDLAPFYARAGRDDLARAVLDDYERLVPEADRLAEQGRLRAARGVAELYAGRAAAALPLLRAEAETSPCMICALPDLARTYEELGQPDSARAIYEQYLTTPQADRFEVDAPWRPLVLFRVAELHEAAGDRAAAIRRYSEFAELWREADPELQPRVETALRRIRALRSAG
jgi:eukaryotic-like serine/threonine-protein kinase